MNLKTKLGAIVVAIAAGTSLVNVSPVSAHPTGIHDNCTKFNRQYPHGVGTLKARDRGASDPVTTFKRSNKIYWAAEHHNGSLDLDNDRVACEKK